MDARGVRQRRGGGNTAFQRVSESWMDPIDQIHDAKRELARLAKKYDAE